MKRNILTKSLIVFILIFTVFSCSEENQDTDNQSSIESTECNKDCTKSCCLGCKATDGEAECIILEDGSMPCCIPEEKENNSEIDCTDAQKAQAQKYLDNNWAPPTNSEDDTQFCREWYDHLVKLSMSGKQDVEDEGISDN